MEQQPQSEWKLWVVIVMLALIALGMWAVTGLLLWIVLSRLGY
jgi:hypothetical protein